MRRFAVAGFVLLFALVGGAAVGLSALTTEDSPANATVSTFEPQVAVGNQSEDPYPDSDGVVTCNDRGPMPGNAGLSGSLVVERPLRDDGPPEPSFRVTVSVDDGALVETHTVSLSTGGSERLVLFGTADRPPSLDGGDTVPVRATVTTENTTVATASRTVEVAERDRPCADEN
ncbi:hypothetical protein C475_05190 [Halosimplex carlsbadense 2-9-1]|uniref:Uncharacterized protein n=1 Tax=Halosimplex carlsbadense 2-9-1 TaxID=797114 RepID=M0CZW8_9EURY|nr:hypothetical protein [Halosimplex carlsbadense]ELZ28173.1 hypothetical protein C475_05190 [Halosimplex carlsbadense 2-9-1]